MLNQYWPRFRERHSEPTLPLPPKVTKPKKVENVFEKKMDLLRNFIEIGAENVGTSEIFRNVVQQYPRTSWLEFQSQSIRDLGGKNSIFLGLGHFWKEVISFQGGHLLWMKVCMSLSRKYPSIFLSLTIESL